MEVKVSSAMLRNVCNCIYHSNVNLILETLLEFIDVYTSYRETETYC